jgi:hypothetical protein
MSETRAHGHSVLGAAIRRFAARVTGLPACVICGRGHAQIGWVVDSFGRIHGRCEGCVHDVDSLARPIRRFDHLPRHGAGTPEEAGK